MLCYYGIIMLQFKYLKVKPTQVILYGRQILPRKVTPIRKIIVDMTECSGIRVAKTGDATQVGALRFWIKHFIDKFNWL